MPVVCSGAGTLIARYDEHALVSRFKFGVLHQRAGQVTEEQLFGNRQITPAFQEFLDLLGQKIDLKDHKGLVTFVTRYLIKNIFKNSITHKIINTHTQPLKSIRTFVYFQHDVCHLYNYGSAKL